MTALASNTHDVAQMHEFASIEALRTYHAVRASRPGEHRAQLVRGLYADVISGRISDDDAFAIQATVDHLQLAIRETRAHGLRHVKLASRRRPRSPDCQASLDRRRMLAGSAVMPPSMRTNYTQGETAALAIVLGEIKRQGVCDAPIDKVAALAGVGRSTTQSALRLARRLGHLKVTERPQRGAKSLTNIVEIASPELRDWVECGPAAGRATGFKTLTAHKNLSATKIIEEKERRRAAVGAPRKDRRERSGEGQGQGLEMKRRNIAPTTRRAEIWIARGSPEYIAWVGKAHAEGRTIPEYRSAITGTTGFWRRSKFPPGHAPDAQHSRAASAHRRMP